jgi:hypothetical protein
MAVIGSLPAALGRRALAPLNSPVLPLDPL